MFKTGDKIKFRGILNKARGAKDNRGIIEGTITHIPENKEWLRVSHSSGPDSIVYPADVVVERVCDCMRCTNGLPGCNQTPAMSSLLSPQFKAVLDFVARCDDRDFRNVLDNIITQRRMAVQDGVATPTAERADYLTRLDDLSVMVNGGTL